MLGVRPEPGVTYLPVHVIELPAPLSAPQGNAAGPCTGSSSSGVGRRIVLAAVHGLSGLFRAVSAVEPSLFRPLPPLSPSLISHLATVDVKQNGPV